MRLAIRHTTHYRFAEPVAHGLQRLRLTPKSTQGQHVLDWTMSYRGAREELAYDDQNFNHVKLVSVEPGATEVEITCAGTVDTEDSAGVIGRHSGHMPLWSFLGRTPLTEPGPMIRALIALKAPGTRRPRFCSTMRRKAWRDVTFTGFSSWRAMRQRTSLRDAFRWRERTRDRPSAGARCD